MRDQFTNDLKIAMKTGQKRRVETIRMVMAALKERDIEARGSGKTVGDEDIPALLQKLVKSRQESAEIYEKAGRAELAAQEREEAGIISAYLPEAMDEAQQRDAIQAAIQEVGATSMKDMGKVVGALKARYAGRMDFSKASAAIKAALAG